MSRLVDRIEDYALRSIAVHECVSRVDRIDMVRTDDRWRAVVIWPSTHLNLSASRLWPRWVFRVIVVQQVTRYLYRAAKHPRDIEALR